MTAFDRLTTLTIHFDGSCNPNPGGLPSWGWHATGDGGVPLAEQSGSMPGRPRHEATNNTAEWGGLIAALKWLAAARGLTLDTLRVYGDSQLVVNGFNREWKMKLPHLAALRDEAVSLAASLDVGHISAEWLPRERNAYADGLSKAPEPVAAAVGDIPARRRRR